MIDVKRTIFRNLKKGMDKLRLLANNDIKLFKKILFLIVLDDMYDWSDYLDAPQPIQKRLQELRNNFILCNRDLDICRFPVGDEYVNVNTPQTNNTWRRVWDAQNLDVLDLDYIHLSATTVDSDEWIHVQEFELTEDGYIKAIGDYVYPSDFDLFDTTVSQDGFIHTEEVPMSQEHILINSYSIDNENYLIH